MTSSAKFPTPSFSTFFFLTFSRQPNRKAFKHKTKKRNCPSVLAVPETTKKGNRKMKRKIKNYMTSKRCKRGRERGANPRSEARKGVRNRHWSWCLQEIYIESSREEAEGGGEHGLHRFPVMP